MLANFQEDANTTKILDGPARERHRFDRQFNYIYIYEC